MKKAVIIAGLSSLVLAACNTLGINAPAATLPAEPSATPYFAQATQPTEAPFTLDSIVKKKFPDGHYAPVTGGADYTLKDGVTYPCTFTAYYSGNENDGFLIDIKCDSLGEEALFLPKPTGNSVKIEFYDFLENTLAISDLDHLNPVQQKFYDITILSIGGLSVPNSEPLPTLTPSQGFTG
jgi:hypothetical protein